MLHAQQLQKGNPWAYICASFQVTPALPVQEHLALQSVAIIVLDSLTQVLSHCLLLTCKAMPAKHGKCYQMVLMRIMACCGVRRCKPAAKLCMWDYGCIALGNTGHMKLLYDGGTGSRGYCILPVQQGVRPSADLSLTVKLLLDNFKTSLAFSQLASTFLLLSFSQSSALVCQFYFRIQEEAL